MLKLNISRHCRLRNKPNSAAYLRSQGFSHWKSHSLLSSELNTITFDTLEELCTLFKCTPNDLFEWTPNRPDEDISEHPLLPLKAGGDAEINLNKLSYAKLKEISRILKEEK